MKEIKAQEKPIRTLLGAKYTVDSYQREYKWEEKQIDDLVDDLLSAFSEYYKEGHELSNVERYGQYFLGPIIVSEGSNIIDGQQRLTTLTLALICLIHLLDDEHRKTPLRLLVYSEKFGKKSFNLDVPERTECLNKLYAGESFEVDGKPESIRNLAERYEQMHAKLESDLPDEQKPLFAEWLIHQVYLVEIKTSSETDAYKIFETMNDRGLRLTPAEILKGYLLSEIQDDSQRNIANNAWKKQVDELSNNKGEDAEAIKAWLRAQYAKEIGDFEEIGSRFHRYVRDNSAKLGLRSPAEFANFITRDFVFYTNKFMKLRRYAEKYEYAKEYSLECIYYLAQHRFTLQYPLLLSALLPDDKNPERIRKLRVVSAYLDILIHRRIGNRKMIAETVMRGMIFELIPHIRNKSAKEIAGFLTDRLEKEDLSDTLAPDFGLHGGNGPKIKRILARITDYVATQAGTASRYAEYFASGKEGFEIEHIWHQRYEEVKGEESLIDDEFVSENDFDTMRNKIGGLLLLPHKDNASYGAKPYTKKREYYRTQNALAGSLHEKFYDAQTRFRQFKEQSGLPFEPHCKFQKTHMEKRQALYRKIADEIWHPSRLHEAAK